VLYVDVGINRVEDTRAEGYRIVGDVHFRISFESRESGHTRSRRRRPYDRCNAIKEYIEAAMQ